MRKPNSISEEIIVDNMCACGHSKAEHTRKHQVEGGRVTDYGCVHDDCKRFRTTAYGSDHESRHHVDPQHAKKKRKLKAGSEDEKRPTESVKRIAIGELRALVMRSLNESPALGKHTIDAAATDAAEAVWQGFAAQLFGTDVLDEHGMQLQEMATDIIATSLKTAFDEIVDLANEVLS